MSRRVSRARPVGSVVAATGKLTRQMGRDIGHQIRQIRRKPIPDAISQPPIEPTSDRFGFRMQLSDIHHVGRRFFYVVDPVDPLGTGELVAPDHPDWVAPPTIDSLTEGGFLS